MKALSRRNQQQEPAPLTPLEVARKASGETYGSMAQARLFWADNLPFVGYLTHWDFNRPITKGRS